MAKNPAEQARTKTSQTATVDSYMETLVHPQRHLLQAIRETIMGVSDEIGEEIKWNAPTFFYSGDLEPSDPKEYKRVLVVSNLFKKDRVRLVFWQGARIGDQSGLLSGDYEDGRRLAEILSMEDLEAKKEALGAIVQRQIKVLVDQN